MIGNEIANPFSCGAIFPNFPSEEYLKNGRRGQPDFVMSRSELMEFNRCPQRWLAGYREDDSDSTDWGSMVDCAALTPSLFNQRYVVHPLTYPDAKTKEPKPWNWNAGFCKQWEKDQGGLKPISFKTAQQVQSAVDRLRKEAGQLIANSQVQVLVKTEYRDSATGIVVPIKCLIDLVPAFPLDKYLIDLKTSKSAYPLAWSDSVFRYDYHVQGAIFLDAYVAATGEDRNTFAHIVQENFEPYQCAAFMLSNDWLEMGRLQYTSALKRYCKCLADNIWPGYETHEQINGFFTLLPKPWMVNQI